MPVFIKLTFPAGRYHTTPWGRHVNEGVAEWPPSPWRLLRALIAVWKRTCPEFTAGQIRRILEPLAQPPRFSLPAFRVAHTRHYMPWEKRGPSDRTLIFDTFVSVNRRDPLIIGWPEADLPLDDRKILATLLSKLSWFGRAEAWVDAELLDESVDLPIGESLADDANPVRVLCPDPLSAFDDKYYPPAPDAKKVRKGLKPNDLLFDCPRWHLCLDTETIHDEGWSNVPGAKWLNYVRPAESVGHTKPANRRLERKFSVARFLLDGPVLPLVTDTVGVAEAFRRAVMCRFGRLCRDNPQWAESFRRIGVLNEFSSPLLSGKELDGTIRKNHCHAYYLPGPAENDPRHITYITVTASEGFGAAEMAALSSLRELKLSESMPLRVQLIGLGNPEDFDLRLFKTSTVWETLTPFVVHRHFKRRGRKRDELDANTGDWRFAFIQLAVRELVARRFSESPSVIEQFAGIPGSPRAIDFRRFRHHRAAEARGRPFSFLRLTFAQPITGPLLAGYGCHFGLGQFVAAETL